MTSGKNRIAFAGARPPPPRPTPAAAGRAAARRAFTLIELVVVLLIIFVLLGLVLPATYALRRSSQRKKAALEAQVILKAIKAYRTTYGQWPAQTQDTEDRTCTDTGPVLGALSTNLALNPRQIPFMEIPAASLANGSFTDPWGRGYVIALDDNMDGSVEIQLSSPFSLTAAVSNESVAVISGGPDPADEQKRIYSWER